MIRVFSYGGGVQSNAVLVLQAQGRLVNPYDVFMFSNVGDDSENPDTLAWIKQYAVPFAESNNIKLMEVKKIRRTGESETLLQYIHRTERSIPIPVKMSNGAPGRRSCTSDFKIDVIDAAIKKMGHAEAVIGLGISLDEFHRARDVQPHELNGILKTREYPLIDLRLGRKDCVSIIESEGLPLPPKSSCWFCPFHRRNEWIEMKRTNPDLFAKVIELERELNHKRESILKKDYVYIHPDLIPIDRAVGNQLPLFPDDNDEQCDDGVCMV